MATSPDGHVAAAVPVGLELVPSSRRISNPLFVARHLSVQRTDRPASDAEDTAPSVASPRVQQLPARTLGQGPACEATAGGGTAIARATSIVRAPRHMRASVSNGDDATSTPLRLGVAQRTTACRCGGVRAGP